MGRSWALIVVAAASFVMPAAAQSTPGLDLQLPTPSRLTAEGPLVRARGILADARMRELLRSGFPARLTYRIELWSDERFFDELHRTAEWEVLVRLRGIDQQYEVTQVVGGRALSLGVFARVEDAAAAVERPIRVPIAAPTQGRGFYYHGSLEVRTLSVTDLDEVSAWLNGELGPAVRGQRNPGTALTRGFRALSTRLLGGERRVYAARTEVFRPVR